jgi:hypothetical protein
MRGSARAVPQCFHCRRSSLNPARRQAEILKVEVRRGDLLDTLFLAEDGC